jgi:Cys-rich repeat protein
MAARPPPESALSPEEEALARRSELRSVLPSRRLGRVVRFRSSGASTASVQHNFAADRRGRAVNPDCLYITPGPCLAVSLGARSRRAAGERRRGSQQSVKLRSRVEGEPSTSPPPSTPLEMLTNRRTWPSRARSNYRGTEAATVLSALRRQQDMPRLSTITHLSLLGSFAAVLAGCPVWGPGARPRTDGGADARADATPTGCSTNAECLPGDICDRALGECVPGSRGCTSTAMCPAGEYCDDRSTCVPGCSSNVDCASQGTGLVCNNTTRRCEAGGGCTTNTECSMGQTCVGGRCRAPAQVCQFNFQCSAGQQCIDGRCVAGCSMAVPCPTGQVCTNGTCGYPSGSNCGACAEGQVCSGGVCTSACTNDMQCGSGFFCDQGACRVDDRRPVPFCPANACGPNSTCVDGVCRIACPGGTLSECQMVDGTTSACDAMRICRFPSELAPECRLSSDCSMGRQCVDARCR